MIRLALVLLLVGAQQLPEPFHTPWYRKITRIVPQPDGTHLQVPPGFKVNVFAEGLRHSRRIALAPNGDVFVTESGFGEIVVLRDADRDGAAERKETFATFETDRVRPFGIAFQEGFLYIGNNAAVVRFPYTPGQMKAEGPPEHVVDLPPSSAAVDRDTAERLGIDISRTQGYNHWTRNVIFSPDGRKMYVTVGSSTNATPDDDPRRAAINEYNPDGSDHRVFAGGLRNPVGMAFYPGSDTLWTAVNERDHLGDDLVPEFATSVVDGGFYGWPYAYIGPNPEPILNGARPDLIEKTLVPDILLPSHSAALGIIFYTGDQFPAEYRNSAFIALHGSINRSELSGYKVVRVPFEDGRPSGEPEDFLTGFIVRDTDDEKEVWGRPVDVLQYMDGSLLLSDDGGNRILRISYGN